MADATSFVLTHARLLERRLFEGSGVREAVMAYRNDDGGFGHALEPDVRATTSQPIFVHFALDSLHLGGVTMTAELVGTCDWLASIATDEGAIPYLLPDAFEHPRAEHWDGDWCRKPSLIATTAVAGGMHAQGVRHEWLDRATKWCLAVLRGKPPLTEQTIKNSLEFLEHLPDPENVLWQETTGRLVKEGLVLLETPVQKYGITPLQYAPTPDSVLRPLFAAEIIEAHLDDLASKQEEDGGWPLSWTPPDGSARNEWRGRWTLDAVRTLRAYGRL